jgi:hypothetical protein
MTQIVNMVLDAIVAKIQETTQANVDITDLTYADVVKKGLLQTNKTKKNVQIGVTGGDHEDPNYLDGIVDLDKMPNIGIQFIAREVGGGQLWWRKGVAKLECFFVREKLTEELAFQAGYDTLGRVMSSIEETSVAQLVDTYDERAIKVYCFANTMFESGGPPNTYIFRGKILWQCLTERP